MSHSLCCYLAARGMTTDDSRIALAAILSQNPCRHGARQLVLQHAVSKLKRISRTVWSITSTLACRVLLAQATKSATVSCSWAAGAATDGPKLLTVPFACTLKAHAGQPLYEGFRATGARVSFSGQGDDFQPPLPSSPDQRQSSVYPLHSRLARVMSSPLSLQLPLVRPSFDAGASITTVTLDSNVHNPSARMYIPSAVVPVLQVTLRRSAKPPPSHPASSLASMPAAVSCA